MRITDQFFSSFEHTYCRKFFTFLYQLCFLNRLRSKMLPFLTNVVRDIKILKCIQFTAVGLKKKEKTREFYSRTNH